MKEVSLTWEEKLQKTGNDFSTDIVLFFKNESNCDNFTGQTQEDRRQALEKVGISIQASGIKVEKDKFFLVNLNSDPSLNELLVYYLKDYTLIGRAGDSTDPDIQLSGVAIQPQHCYIQMNAGALSLTPILGARTCVNGVEVKETTKLENGDRILWGSNHYFRVNCPTTSSKCFYAFQTHLFKILTKFSCSFRLGYYTKRTLRLEDGARRGFESRFVKRSY